MMIKYIIDLDTCITINEIDKSKGLNMAIEVFLKSNIADRGDIFLLQEKISKVRLGTWIQRKKK